MFSRRCGAFFEFVESPLTPLATVLRTRRPPDLMRGMAEGGSRRRGLLQALLDKLRAGSSTFPGADSTFSKACGGISGRASPVEPAVRTGIAWSGQGVSEVGGRVGFPGADSTFSRPCGGISGRASLVGAAGRTGITRSGQGVSEVGGRVGFPGADSTFSKACGGISGRASLVGAAGRTGITRSGQGVSEVGGRVGFPGAGFNLFKALRRNFRARVTPKPG